MSSAEFTGSDEVWKEGFLCPMCMEDLKSFHNLQRHFDLKHSNEDKAIMKQIKGVFTRAKEKILNKDLENEDNSVSGNFAEDKSYKADTLFWEPQESGMMKHRMGVFRSIRDARIDRSVVETNKILIRLDKVLQIQEADQGKRKDLERTLVPWVQDEDVPFCPTCGDKFNIVRRRHHCRLCGAIMCSRCSIFLNHREAEEMLQKNEKFNQANRIRGFQRPSHNLEMEEAETMSIRVCVECDGIVRQSQEKLNLEFSSSLLVKLHAKMVTAMDAAVKLSPEFEAMAESLNIGEEEYELDVAIGKRQRLMQMFEAVDVISKKISALSLEDGDNRPTIGFQKLQQSIRKAACLYLQENMLSLPSLPSAPKLITLQARRRAENEKRLRRQREEARKLREEQRRQQNLERLLLERDQAEKHIPSQDPTPVEPDTTPVAVGNPGWSASPTNSRISSSDMGLKTNREDSDDDIEEDDVLRALREQISYVEESLKQAKGAGMRSEASSLARNLEELNSEYKRQQAARAFGDSFTVSGGTVTGLQDESIQADSSENGSKDAMLYQIQYVTKCIEDSKAAGKFDEVKILTDNLNEIKRIYADRLKN